MRLTRLMKFFTNSSLNTIFRIVVFFASGVPLILTTTLIFSNYHHEIRISEAENAKLKSVTANKLRELLKDIRSNLRIIAQNEEIVEILSVKSDIRVFIENRAYGRIVKALHESKIALDWALVGTRPSEIIFSSNKSELNANILSEFQNENILLKNQSIYLMEVIKLDDQNLPGPNSTVRGYLVGRVTLSSLKALMPDLNQISAVEQIDGVDRVEIEIYQKVFLNPFLIPTVLVMVSSLFISIGIGLFLFRKQILQPLKSISFKLQRPESGISKNEISILEKAIEIYIENLKINESEKTEKEKLIAANLLASQVAHDIRSPLTALNMVIGTIDKLPEDKRILIRNAIQRINDIANDLLSRGKAIPPVASGAAQSQIALESSSTSMLSSLVDTLISEKRIQYRDKIDIQIGAELSNSYGLFAKLPANEYKRLLSNLINNSVEALENGSGKILVTLEKKNAMIKIEIIDNGKGIPPDILNQFGNLGVTSGKSGTESGSGLGVHHAFKFMKSIDGQIEFSNISNQNSKLGSNGTKVTMLIPPSQPPVWFVKVVEIPKKGRLVALDDDQSIHSVWQGRLASIKGSENNVTLVSFTSAEIFKNWVISQRPISNDHVFLIDYELLGQKVIGLDLIEELGLQKLSILVSSRYDEKNVYERCKRLGVRIIPKTMAGLVPIEIIDRQTTIDAVLIDDDPLIHMTWKISAKQNGKKFLSFKTHFEFLENAKSIPFKTPIVIDSQLGSGIKGEQVSKEIYDLGFSNIYLGTGSPVSSFVEVPWIIGILGKTPEWEKLV